MRSKLIFLLLTIAALIGCSAPGVQNQANQTVERAVDSSLRAIAVSAADADAAEPSIAVGTDETVFVVWVEHRTKSDADLMIRRFDAAGQAKAPAMRINPIAGQVKSWFGDAPCVKVGQDNRVYVSWTAKNENPADAGNVLYLSVSTDGGNSFAAPVKVNDDAIPASHGMHSLAIDKAGRVYLAWLDERYLNADKEKAALETDSDRSFQFEKAAFFHHKDEAASKAEPNAELYFAVSTNGGKTFAPNKRLAKDVCPCCKTTLLAASDDRLYASWRQVLKGDFRHIAVASSTNGGDSFSAPVIVSDDKWQISACPVSGAALAEGADKSLKVAWFTGGAAGKPGIYFAESKDAGVTFAARSLVSDNAASGTPVLMPDKTNQIRIIWAETGKIMTETLTGDEANAAAKKEVVEGELAAAAFDADKIFVGFVEKETDKRRVKLAFVK